MVPVDPLAVERDAQAEAGRIGVAAALRRADLSLALPILPEFRLREPGSRRIRGGPFFRRAPSAIIGQQRVDLGQFLGAGLLRQLAARLDLAVLLARPRAGHHPAPRVGAGLPPPIPL